MQRYRKIYKIIALWNSFNSLEQSDYSAGSKEVDGAMQYCIDEICRLGVDPNKLPGTMPELIEYLKQVK